MSAEILEESGIEGFNTNLLAERAGVAVRAIYRYFPNKYAILLTMSQRHRELEREWIGNVRGLSTAADWRKAIQLGIDNYFEAASKCRGFAAIRAASRASPELSRLDDRTSHAFEQDLAIGLRGLGVRISDKRLAAVCRTFVETSTRMLDIALQCDPAEARLLIRELKGMIITYLEGYVEPGR